MPRSVSSVRSPVDASGDRQVPFGALDDHPRAWRQFRVGPVGSLPDTEQRADDRDVEPGSVWSTTQL